jgi:hypothetical protein
MVKMGRLKLLHTPANRQSSGKGMRIEHRTDRASGNASGENIVHEPVAVDLTKCCTADESCSEKHFMRGLKDALEM